MGFPFKHVALKHGTGLKPKCVKDKSRESQRAFQSSSSKAKAAMKETTFRVQARQRSLPLKTQNKIQQSTS